MAAAPDPDGEIWEPEEAQEMVAGEDFWAFGDYDLTLEENGPLTIVVKIAFLKPGQTSETLDLYPSEWSSGSWWVNPEATIPVPGGAYIGGTWHVELWVNGVPVDHHGGPIVSGEV